METRSVALIVGGGAGAHAIDPVLGLLDAAGARFDFHRVDVSVCGAETPEDYLEKAAAQVSKHGIALKTKIVGDTRGAQWHSIGNTAISPNVALRQVLDLYAGVRPIRSQPGLPTRYPDLDLLLVRENTEDIYKGIEHEVVPGVVQSIKVVTQAACERIARYTFNMAAKHNRQKVTFIHKANIMKRSDGLFRETVSAVAAEFPKIEHEDRIVDAACMQLVLDPYRFDVVLTGNLYGDILSSLGSGLAGGISNAHAINIGDDSRVFEAIHGDKQASLDHANPLPVLSAGLALLRHFDEHTVADRIGNAIGTTLTGAQHLTPDLGGKATCAQMCQAISAVLAD